jgi:hypothetical protein
LRQHEKLAIGQVEVAKVGKWKWVEKKFFYSTKESNFLLNNSPRETRNGSSKWIMWNEKSSFPSISGD